MNYSSTKKSTNYMTEHLLEAITLNGQRKELYSELTGGKSLKVSRLLILLERLCLISSFPLDNIAKFWQKRGVPVMVHEYIPMDQTPDFKSQFDDSQGLHQSLPNFNTKLLQKDIFKLFKNSEYKKLDFFIEKTLKEMNDFSKHYCMIRHLLESIRRGVNLQVKHINKAQELGVKSPKLFCQYINYNQILVLNSSKIIDKWAHPIQKDGVPIVYQDVPFIAPYPELY